MAKRLGRRPIRNQSNRVGGGDNVTLQQGCVADKASEVTDHGAFLMSVEKRHVTYIAGKLKNIFFRNLPVTGVTV
jgi:hypothetical protein